MLTIPLASVPAQTVNTVVGGQNCQIYVYQKDQGMFFDLNSNGVDVVVGVLCENANPLVCIQYTGFQGNFIFIDTQGISDPLYTGLGNRFELVYLTAAENALVEAG